MSNRLVVDKLMDLPADELDGVFAAAKMPPTHEKQLRLAIKQRQAQRSPLDFLVAADHTGERARHLEIINDVLMSAVHSERGIAVIISTAVRHGKASSASTKLITLDGWKDHGSIAVGDYVFHPSGKPIKVMAKSQVFNDALLRVHFNDGSQIDCHPNHEWTVHANDAKNKDGSRKYRTFEARDFLERNLSRGEYGKGNHRWTHHLPNLECLEFPEADLPIDPYTFGIWLGDGTNGSNTFCSQDEDIEIMMRRINNSGEVATISRRHATTGLLYANIDKIAVRLRDNYGLLTVGDAKKLQSTPNEETPKIIPEEYLCSSERQRRELLAGLVDTDGHVEKGTGRVRIRSVDRNLLEQIRVLVKSLGYFATVNMDDEPRWHIFPDGEERWCNGSGVVQFTPHDGIAVGHLPRKQVPRTRHRSRVAITKVEEVESEDSYCIQVDSPDGLYVAGEDLLPTHNSYLTSEYFPAWMMGRYPEKNVILASYNKQTSTNFTSKARDNFMDHKELFNPTYKLDESRKAKDLWGVAGYGGGVMASGMGSSIIGYGADLIVCDDMYKDSEQAFSATYEKALKNWWSSTLSTRLQPGCSIVLVLARWSTNDLAGWLLEESKRVDDKRDFFEIKIPAIAGEDDALGREPGEVLWPEKWDKAALREREAEVGPLIWSCQYQQEPQDLKDTMFAPKNWQYYPFLGGNTEIGEDVKVKVQLDPNLDWIYDGRREIPKDIKLVRFWDTTGGGEWSDYLCGLLMARDGAGRVLVLDVVREKFTGDRANQAIEARMREVSLADAQRYHDRVVIRLEEVGGVAKTTSTHYISTVFAGFNAGLVKPRGSKVERSQPVAAQQQIGNVFLVRDKIQVDYREKNEARIQYEDQKWFPDFISELSAVSPSGTGKNDDQLDGLSGAFNSLFDIRGPSHGKVVSFGARRHSGASTPVSAPKRRAPKGPNPHARTRRPSAGISSSGLARRTRRLR